MKKFWKRARGKGNKKKGHADNEFDPDNKERWNAMVQELVGCLDEYEGAVYHAKLEYQWSTPPPVRLIMMIPSIFSANTPTPYSPDLTWALVLSQAAGEVSCVVLPPSIVRTLQ
eukprot:3279240-Rhodomonas_salina.1